MDEIIKLVTNLLQSQKDEIIKLITEEIATAHMEGTSTARLTSLYNKVLKL